MSDDRLAYLWYGDDFTGASDTLATFAKAGLRAVLCLGVPSPARLASLGTVDALGIAGAARAMSPAEMRAELEPVARFSVEQRPRVFHYKCCSTFDSAPETGSIGVAALLLRSHIDPAHVLILGGQPSLGRYCAFGNLFASAGLGGDVFRIDRHPTMATHPVTPMLEADLRRHLALQGLPAIDLVTWCALEAATGDDLVGLLANSGNPVLFDVLTQAHLATIGALMWREAREERPVLAIGASSVAEALVSHWRTIGTMPEPGAVAPVAPAHGPVFVLAGSQSPVTAGQIEIALTGGSAAQYRGVAIDVAAIVADPGALQACAGACVDLLVQGHSVIAQTGSVREGAPSRRAVAEACGRLVASVADRAPMVRRIGVAGGDTSSLAMAALDLWALTFSGMLSPGVPLVRALSDNPARDGLDLMLKGGQMGPADLFLRLKHGTTG